VARRLIWSPRARRNLRDILDHIAKDSPRTASTVARRFFTRAASLPDQPGQGRRVPDVDMPSEVREVFVHRWRVIYMVSEAEVRIVAIVHTARLLRNLPPL